MRRTLASLLLLALPLASAERIAISPDHHFLQTQSGAPFFWLADTAWLLFNKLEPHEIERYLDNRQQKGFNVIQVMVLQNAEAALPDGTPALVGGDPARPDLRKSGYWDRVDWVIDRAADRGIQVAMVTAWGSLIKRGQLNESNAESYARFLARRYKDKPNVVWVLGGDIQGDLHRDVWVTMGRTLKADDHGHLITYHPFGRTQSSTWFHDEPWLDFNLFQSGHQRYDQDTKSPHAYGEDNWRYARDDYARKPPKPVIDGEPSYENIPQGLHDPKEPYWTADDCRRYAWWSVFTGAAGHTYGDNAVMQFYRPGDEGSYGVRKPWTEEIDAPGSAQMQFVKRLMLSRPYFVRVPDQSLIAGENGTKYDYVEATRGEDYAFAYTYTGRPFTVRMGAIRGARVRASWYNPRDGSTAKIGSYPNRGTVKFTPPGSPRPGNDWVLVLDSDVTPPSPK